MIFIIEKLWLDSMENRWDGAMGYDIIGYVTNEEHAKEIVQNGGFEKKEACWTLDSDTPKYSYRKIELYSI